MTPEPCDHVFEAQYCIKTTGMFEGKKRFNISFELLAFANEVFWLEITNFSFTGQIGTKRYCSSRDYGDYCDYIRRPGDERDYRSCVFTCSSDACNKAAVTHSVTRNFCNLAIVLTVSLIHKIITN